MPLPEGWTAGIERESLDETHTPPYVVMELLFTGPDGAAIRTHAKVEQPDTIGLTPQGRFNHAWYQVADYVLHAIDDLATRAPVALPPGSIDTQVNVP